MSSIEWILFDLGGVLVEVDQSRIFSQLAHHTEQSSKSVRDTLLSVQELWEPMVVQEWTPSEATRKFNQVLGTQLSEEQIVESLNAELGATIEATANLLPRLQRRRKIGCLSNTNSIHWDALLSSYSFMHLFDRRFASQLLGSAKPSKEIYQRVVTLLGTSPRQILFFDDRQENVDAARSEGWNARIYRSHEGLIRDLEEFEIAL